MNVADNRVVSRNPQAQVREAIQRASRTHARSGEIANPSAPPRPPLSEAPPQSVSPVAFDEEEYLAANPDVADLVRQGLITALDHWESQGRHEGRRRFRPVSEWLDQAGTATRDAAAASAGVGGEPPSPPTLRGKFGSYLVRAVRHLFTWYQHGLRRYLDANERRSSLVLSALRSLARDTDTRLRHTDVALSRLRSSSEQISLRLSELESIQIRNQSTVLEKEPDPAVLSPISTYESTLLAVTAKVEDMSAQLETVNTRLQSSIADSGRIEELARMVRNTVAAEHRAWVEAVERSTAQLSARINQVEADSPMHMRSEVSARLEEIHSEIRGEVERQNNRLYEIGGTVDTARRLSIANEARIGMALREFRRTDRAVPAPDSAIAQAPSAFTVHYAGFEDIFRGTREEIKQRLLVYLPVFEAAGVGTAADPIVDLGCGRGEWLELLRELGKVARGVDMNPEMVERSVLLGLQVEPGDALDYLRKQPDASLGAVTTFHMVEHLPFDDVILLLSEGLRTLRSGGVLLFETPNPNNIFVGSRNFYTDPTHRNPLPCGLMRFITESLGFCDAVIREVNPLPTSLRLPDDSNAAVRFINDNFFGPQDYAIIARKY